MRARVFLREEDSGWRLACELDAENPDEVWRALEAEPDRAGRPLATGDVVYITDIYYELDGDGGWHQVQPGPLTRDLYRLITQPHDPLSPST